VVVGQAAAERGWIRGDRVAVRRLDEDERARREAGVAGLSLTKNGPPKVTFDEGVATGRKDLSGYDSNVVTYGAGCTWMAAAIFLATKVANA